MERRVPWAKQLSQRYRLRTRLLTGSVASLNQIDAAAGLFGYRDLQTMAMVKRAIEQVYISGDTLPLQTDRQLDTNQLRSMKLYDSDICGKTFLRANYQGQNLILDQIHLRSPLSAHKRKTIEATAFVLGKLGRLGISILPALGHLEDDDNGPLYAFQVPEQVSSEGDPVTLHELLIKPLIPALNERFKLAQALTSTIFTMHGVELYHRGIRPQNILFWSQPQSNQRKINISKPYLVGFGTGLARTFDYSGDPDEKPDFAFERPIHIHPAIQSFRHPYQPAFDMYSLGVVLCEIGMWHSMGSDFLHLDPTTQGLGIRTRQKLAQFVGQRYADAVTACLSPELERTWKQHSENGETQLRTYLDWVQDHVVDPIARCDV